MNSSRRPLEIFLANVKSSSSFQCRNDEILFAEIYFILYDILGHNTKNCDSMNMCEINGCQQSHHPLLHSEKDQAVYSESTHLEAATNHHEQDEYNEGTLLRAQDQELNSGSVHAHRHGGTYFHIVPVELFSKGEKIDTYAFLDSGCNMRMIENTLMNKLCFKGPSHSLKLK